MGGAVQSVDAVNDDAVCPCAADAGAHGDQAVCQIDDFRLARSIFEHRFAIGQYRSHHQVLGAGDGDHVGEDASAFESRRLGLDVALLDVDFCTHGLQALDVLIDRPCPDGTATRQRYPRFAAACQQRAKHENRGAHGLDHVVRRERIVEATSVEDEAVVAVHGHSDTHLPDQAQHRRYIVELRQIPEPQGLVRQQAGAEDRQRRILGAGNGDVTGKRYAALNQQFIHG